MSFAARVSYFTIIVADLDKSATLLSQAGFTLKVPHTYKEGHQKGLIVQSIKLKNGQYFQIMALDSQASKLGALAKWSQSLLKESDALGASLVIEDTALPLKKIHSLLKENKIESQLKTFPRYSWLSFKTQSPYSPVSFIKQDYFPSDAQELLTHENQAKGLGHLEVRPFGNPETWSKIMTLSGSTQSQINFDTPLFSGKGFIHLVEIRSSKRPLPKPVKLGHITLKFIENN